MAEKKPSQQPDILSLLKPVLSYSHCYVALSGGLDSGALLHATAHFFKQLQHDKNFKGTVPALSAIHVDHQLMSEHAAWRKHCEQLCQTLNVPLITETVEVKQAGAGLEQAARISRYHAFEKHIEPTAVLLMGHHANDQAETLLLRLLRGAGIEGAASIPEFRNLKQGEVFRPFLALSRQQLQTYSQQHNLPYIEDGSNTNTKLDRNYIRHKVLPVLTQRWPHLVKTFGRFTQHAADAKILLRDLAAIDLQRVELNAGCYGAALSASEFNKLSSPRQANLLRYWLDTQAIQAPEYQHLQQMLSLINHNRSATSVPLKKVQQTTGELTVMEFCVFQNRCYLLNKSRLNAACDFEYYFAISDQDPCFRVADLVAISVSHCEQGAPQAKCLKAGQYHIAARQAGAKCKVNGQHKTLKKLMPALGIPNWLRDSYPIIYQGEQVVAIGDLLICDGFAAERGWKITLDWRS